MSVGARAKAWFDSLQGTPGPARTRAADRLLDLNEHYFDDKKVTRSEREQLIEVLGSLASEPELAVRRCVARLLGLLQVGSDATRDLLSDLLGDEHPEVHVHAIWAAARLGHGASSLNQDIARLANSTSHDVRWRVAWALGEVGQKTPETHSALLHLSGDQDALTRMHSLDSLAKCAEATNIQIKSALSAGLDDIEPIVRGAACRTIESLPWGWADQLAKIRHLALYDGAGGNFYAMLALVRHNPNCMTDPPVRAWLESNRKYGWVNALFPDA